MNICVISLLKPRQMNPTAKLFSFILLLLQTFSIQFTHLTINFRTQLLHSKWHSELGCCDRVKDLTRSKKVHFSQLLTSAVCCLACWPHLVTLAPDWAHSSGGRSQFNTSGQGWCEWWADSGRWPWLGWAGPGSLCYLTSLHTQKTPHWPLLSLCMASGLSNSAATAWCHDVTTLTVLGGGCQLRGCVMMRRPW